MKPSSFLSLRAARLLCVCVYVVIMYLNRNKQARDFRPDWGISRLRPVLVRHSSILKIPML